MGARSELLVGLDIGTTKICAVISERAADGTISVIGVGHAPSGGLRRGIVTHIDKTTDSIRRAVEEAQLMAGTRVRRAFVGIAGAHIESHNSEGSVAIKRGEVFARDVDRVIDAAREMELADDREVLHILPQEFVVDAQDGIREPIGMRAGKLTAKVHIVTTSSANAENVLACAQRAGLQVKDVVLDPLASSEAVLSLDERELGVALVDLGGGTTDLAIWSDGSVVHTHVIALGGDHLTNDIAIGLRTPSEHAENLKKRHGCAMTALISRSECIDVPSVGGRAIRRISRHLLAEIIEPRLEEMLALVKKELVGSGYGDLLVSGVVLTGGAASMHGLTELAEDILGMPVRIGVPERIGGLLEVVRAPSFATGVGLAKYGHGALGHRRTRLLSKGPFARLRVAVSQWLGDTF